MERYKIGNLAKSIAGHDKDELYVIVGEDRAYVYVADGRLKKMQKPKHKNKKHIQPIYQKDACKPELLSDEEIRRAIKLYNKQNQNQEGEQCRNQM